MELKERRGTVDHLVAGSCQSPSDSCNSCAVDPKERRLYFPSDRFGDSLHVIVTRKI